MKNINGRRKKCICGKIVWIILCVSALLFLDGCKKEEYIDIAYSAAEKDNSRAVKIEESLVEAAEENNLIIESMNAEGNLEQQRKDIEYLLEKNPQYLVVTPVKTLGLEKELEKAKEQGIKIILYDRTAGSSSFNDYLAVVASDACYDGGLCAEELARYFGEKEARILEITGPAGSSLTRDRSKGFRKKLCEYAKLDLIKVVAGYDDRLQTKNMLESLLMENKDINAVFVHTGEDGVGAALALQEIAEEKYIPIVSAEGKQDTCCAVCSGCCEASVMSNADLGEYVTEIILDDMQGKQGTTEILVKGKSFNKFNIGDMTEK